MVLLYEFNCFFVTGTHLWHKRLSGDHEQRKFSKDALGYDHNHESTYDYKVQETFYNPVLQNASALLDFLNTTRKDRLGKKSRTFPNSRKKRSTNRNCAGQCEQSLCTWREEWDEERTRVPQFIKYAVCDSPRCNFEFAGLDNEASFALQINTHCDLVRIDIEVTDNGETKWLTDWPIACICTQRVVNVLFSHPGRENSSSIGQIDVDIANNESVDPVPRQHIVLSGVRHRSLSRAQRRRLRTQRRNMQNTESWEEIMWRKSHRN